MKGCRNCPAYAKCEATYRSSACAALRGRYGIDVDPEIITNADCIRKMSEKELAVFLSDFKDCAEACFVGKGVKDCNGICATAATLEIWLSQPAKGESR